MTVVEVSSGSLPERPRRLLVELAAVLLGELPETEVPAALRRVRAFAPARRARAGAGPLALALDRDPVFRQRVAAAWRLAHPELAVAVEPAGAEPVPEPGADTGEDSGPDDGPASAPVDADPPSAADLAADPEQALVGLYLVRPPDWQALGEPLVRALADQAQDQELLRSRAGEQAREDAVTAQAERARADLARARAERDSLAEEVNALRRDQRRLRADADRARATARAQERDLAGVQARAAELEAELARARSESAELLREARDLAEQTRRAAREGRSLADTRARLLLDTILEAASGLRRELALPPASVRPADLVTGASDERPAEGPSRTVATDDPAMLEHFLALPQSHLLVDGYNVTKTAFAELTLAEQRRRLVEALAVLAVRTATEVTCCFDGADVEARTAIRVRGVRVLFSDPGMTADELIRRLVRAEPPGRPVIVVSSDAEVVAGVRAAGARTATAATLAKVLARA